MIVIGELVNATRKRIREAIQGRDAAAIREVIEGQAAAGADFVDLNAGTGAGAEQETRDLCWLVDLALECTERPLGLDAADPVVLSRAAEHLDDRRPFLVNSVNGERERLELLLPLAVERGAPVIALCMDGSGIPADAAGRLAVAERLIEAATGAGIPEDGVFLDPLVMPLSADISKGKLAFDTLEALHERFPAAHTVMGVSNVSHGLPKRVCINEAFLTAAITHGLDSAICDPTHPGIRRAILLGELIAGRDRHCRRYTRAVRKGDLS
jgi:5-methyltetrahydrofolate--homocysteine methyltransferase